MLIGAIIAARVLRERARRADQEETDDESLNA
jgi:hypothetical protein